MLPHKSNEPIYKLTAQTLSMDENLVRNVVDYQFQFAKEWMKEPIKPALYLPEWGTYELKLYSVRNYLHNMVQMMRQNPEDEELKERFRYWWKKRIPIREYLKSKKRPKIKKQIDERIKAKKDSDTSES